MIHMLKGASKVASSSSTMSALTRSFRKRQMWRRPIPFDLLTGAQTKKATKGVPVEDLKFGCGIRQIVQRLQNKNLEQQDDIVPLRTNIGLSTLVSGLLKCLTKHLSADRLVNLGSRVGSWLVSIGWSGYKTPEIDGII